MLKQPRAEKASRVWAAGIPPHVLFFCLYNLLYFIPLFLVFLWGYADRGAVNAVGMDLPTMRGVTFLYAVGIVAFAAGSLPLAIVRKLRAPPAGAVDRHPEIKLLRVKLSDELVIILTVCVFLMSKVALIPLGVYHSYAFGTGEMTGGLWTFSMFCSETLVLFEVAVLFSSARHNVLGFVVLATLNAVNLLHGTRIFFIVTFMSAVVYAYMRGHLPLRRLMILGPILGCLVLSLTYVVFLSRSGLSASGAFTAVRVVSPIVYESLFSQIPLVTLLKEPQLWTVFGHVGALFSDIVTNLTPRALLPDKDALLFFSRYNDISPLGAMNGYAAGLIYFGLFYPLFYFTLGLFGSWLYDRARTGGWWMVLYGYFTADFIFRVMRDGYLIPIKMLVNTVEILVILLALRVLFSSAKRKMEARPSTRLASP